MRTRSLVALGTLVVATLSATGPGTALAASSGTAGATVPRQAASTGQSRTLSSLATRATKPVRVPGNLTGLGFDTCSAPDQASMDELRTQSPYWAVGVYIGGESRGCRQPELTRTWVRTQHAKGWRIIPIWNGLQAPTLKLGGGRVKKCSSRPAHPMSSRNAVARKQGIRAANRAVDNAKALGMARGSTLFLDIEAYVNTDSACNQPVLHFQSGWNQRLRGLGWKSGFYSSAGSGITALDYVRSTYPGTYVMPDVVWFGWGNGRANLDGGTYLRDSFWPTQRMHQYELDVVKRFGRFRGNVDQNVVSIGRGSRPGPARHTCGVDVDFPHYFRYHRGDRSVQVKAAQCLLKRHHLYTPRLTSRFTLATAHGIATYQDRRGLRVTGTLNASTWASLLSGGTTPLVKRGSANDRVRFLQRAVTAALGHTVPISGLFDGATTSAVKRYQRAVGLKGNGVVDGSTWKALQKGRH